MTTGNDRQFFSSASRFLIGATTAFGLAAGAMAQQGATGVPTSPAAAPTADASVDPDKEVKTDLYTVKGGIHVDKKTMDGFRIWRAAACDRCHGANQEGAVGPSLVESLKHLSKAEFQKTVLEGRLEKGMPSFNTSERVVHGIDDLYSYLKGRSDGAITQARVKELE